MNSSYSRLRDLLATPPYDVMAPAEAEVALNAASIPSAGTAMLAPDEFVARFTPAEFVAASDSPDAVVRLLMFRLRARRDPLDLASATVRGGLAYMAGQAVPGLGAIAAPILTPQRAAEIGAVQAGPTISPREALGWPEPRIWASDVIAARAMEG